MRRALGDLELGLRAEVGDTRLAALLGRVERRELVHPKVFVDLDRALRDRVVDRRVDRVRLVLPTRTTIQRAG